MISGGGQSVRAAAVAKVTNPPGVEKGVTGKERMFQQNRAFGPGAMKPYPARPYSEPRINTNRPGGSTNSGVYHGGARARPIPSGGEPRQPEFKRGERLPQGGRAPGRTIRSGEIAT